MTAYKGLTLPMRNPASTSSKASYMTVPASNGFLCAVVLVSTVHTGRQHRSNNACSCLISGTVGYMLQTHNNLYCSTEACNFNRNIYWDVM